MPRKSTERQNPLEVAGLERKPSTTGAPPVEDAPPPPVQNGLPPASPEDIKGQREKSGGRESKSDDEKATEKVTAYFTPVQYDKIEELQRAYRKRAKKRISVNALLRRLVENAAVEDILP